MTILFEPGWTVAPAAALRVWLRDHRMTARRLGVQVGGGIRDICCVLQIEDVLARKSLKAGHAETLERGTGIPARYWLEAERLYRRDLAAGRKDVTDE